MYVTLFVSYCFQVEHDVNDINKLECELSKVSLIEDLPKEQPKETESEKSHEPASNSYWFSGLLDGSDLVSTNPHQGAFVQQLEELAIKKKEVLNDSSLSKEDKKERLHSLQFTTNTGVNCHVEDLGYVTKLRISSKTLFAGLTKRKS